MRLYIIRHADPDYPNNTITPAGRLEARALAKRLAREGLTRIYCSPLGRAIDTMRFTAELTGIQPVTEEWTRELSDCTVDVAGWGRLSAWDLPGEVIRGHGSLPTSADWSMVPFLNDPRFRRKFDEVRRNSDAFLERHGYRREGWRYRCVSPNRERIAVLCHGGLGLTWIAHLLELPLPLAWCGMWLAPSSVTTILFDERSKEWAVPRCIGLSDVSHLYAEGLPVQPAGIIANFD